MVAPWRTIGTFNRWAAMDADIATLTGALQRGGVIAYPTEGVFGLGCDPLREDAVARIFALKGRPADQGVLLVAGDFEALVPWIDLAAVPPARLDAVRSAWPGPVTFVFPASVQVPPWIAGRHGSVALRHSAHAPVAGLSRAFGSALVSTSANRHGDTPARSAAEVRALFGDGIDGVLDAATGGLPGPTPIRDALSGAWLRR